MVPILVAALVFLAVMAIGCAVAALLSARRKALNARLEQAEESAPQENTGGLTRFVGSVGKAIQPSGSSRTLAEKLARSGYYSKSAPAVFMGSKMVLMLAGLAGAGFLIAATPMPFISKLLLALCIGGIFFFLPNLIVRARWRAHRREIGRHLPDVIDLMEICVCSGMGLDMAWNLIADEIRTVSRVLADEMVLTNLEVHLGAPRILAIRNMAQRTGAEEVASLATLLAQSERFGTSMADALRTFAQGMRQERSVRAQETAEKVAVKLLFPMILFIFPALLVVLAGPAAIRLIAVLGS